MDRLKRHLRSNGGNDNISVDTVIIYVVSWICSTGVGQYRINTGTAYRVPNGKISFRNSLFSNNGRKMKFNSTNRSYTRQNLPLFGRDSDCYV